MLSKTIAGTALMVFLGPTTLVSQQTPAASNASSVGEFPVIMQQSLDAGKAPVGAKVQAKLLVATLVNGVVIPRGAILSGEVTESVAKSKTAPSRLSIRMDSSQWKTGSAPIKAYLTAWYYPEAAMANQDLQYEPLDSANSKTKWNGMGTYPDQNNPVSQGKFPGRDTDGSPGPDATSPASRISNHRVLMKNVESARAPNGAVTLTSQRSTIKIDRVTTYVLATSDLLSKK